MTTKTPVVIERRPVVINRTGLSSTRIDELEKADRFPRRVRLSDRAVGWVSTEITAWIEQRIGERDSR